MPWDQLEHHFPAMAGLLKRAKSGRGLAHAYLIHCDRTDAAQFLPTALAQLASCLNPKADGAPCGVCRHCQLLENEKYPELYKLMPVSKSRQIKVGEDTEESGTMRWFEHRFYLTSDRNDMPKIGIISEADCLNEAAQNAFLKTLEEPPGHALLLLVSARPEKLLPTIRSRCQTLAFLTNVCTYDQPFIPDLIRVLLDLKFTAHNDLAKAEEAAGTLIERLKSLKEDAALRQNEQFADTMTQMKENEWSAKEKKWMESRIEGAVQSDYLSMRDAFLNAIYDHCALSYQQALGISANLQGACAALSPEIERDNVRLTPDEAERHFLCAQKLIKLSHLNVQEELLIRTFALNIAFDTAEHA